MQTLTIVGIALSPEYVYQIRGNDLVPDDRRFGVFWMEEEQLAAVFDMEGAFNDLSVQLLRGVSEREVLTRIDRLVEPYGGAGAYGRDEQISARFLDNEITQLKGTALIAPLIFLGVASFLLNVVVTRLISTQREQIAALKAFGYSNWEVGGHYLLFVVLIALVGTALGTALGVRLGQGITGMYAEFYHFPVILYRFDPAVVSWAIVVSLMTAVVGTLGAVWTAIRLPPAEAMRPAPPAQFRETLLERLGWSQVLSSTGRMVVRELERRPMKALLATLGISFAVAVLVLGNFGMDAVNYMMTFQYFVTQRQDVSVAFVEPLTASAEYELRHLPGVLRCETYRTVPVRVRHGQRYRRTVLMGLPRERELYRLIDADENVAKLPPVGIMLSDKLAELLGVTQGETVIVEVLEGQRPVWEVPVTATIAEFAGTNAYMDREALATLLREEGSISGAHLRVDATRLDELYDQLKHTPRVAGVTIKTAAYQSFQDTVAENQLRFQSFNVMFACVIAFGVVYNTARISLSERSREMGTLRVIGFTRGEISAILLGELAILTLAAIPPGFAIGYGFAWLVTKSVPAELFRFPLVISLRTLAFAAAVTLLAAAISALIVRRRLDRLDLVSVLKQRE